MPFTLADFSKRVLEASFPVEREDAGEGKPARENFRIGFYDFSRAELENIIREISEQTIKEAAAYQEKTKTISDEILDAARKITDLTKDGAKNEEEIEKLEKLIEAKNAELAGLAEPYGFDELLLSRQVSALPDLLIEPGVVAEPTAETFKRLPRNVCALIQKTIAEQRSVVDEKKLRL